MRVSEIMTTNVEAVSTRTNLTDAARRMRSRDIGFLPVVEKDIVVGVITDRDITLRGLGEGCDPSVTTAGDIMTREVICCHKDEVLTEAGKIMEEHQVRRLLVVDNTKKLVGLLSLDDLAANMSSDRLLGNVLRHVTGG